MHYVYKDKITGDLIRVLPGLYPSRLSENALNELSIEKELYIVFFPLFYAHKKGIVQRVGRHVVENYEKPQFMRSKHMIRGEFMGWHIIDTYTWQRQLVRNLTKDQMKLSPWGLWNDTLLIERLLEGWLPENWH